MNTGRLAQLARATRLHRVGQGFESLNAHMNFFERHNTRVETLVNFKGAYEKIESISENKMDPDSFADLYDKNMIATDVEKAKKLKVKFDQRSEENENLKEAKVLSEILEYIVFDQGESANWFGENAYMIKTSDFDDFINGIDVVAEFDLGESVSRAGFAIDATFGHSPITKIEKIKQEIREGKDGVVKYFESGDGSYRGMLKSIPKVFIGADPENTKKIINLWANEDRLERDKLINHPVQFNFLKQIIMECGYFSDFAKECGQEKMAESYSRLSRIIQKILEEKGGDQRGLEKDEFMIGCENHLT